MRASANRAAAARGGWRPHTSRGGFFDFIYVIIDAIGNCMQNFIEIDRKKNKLFSFKSSDHCFPVTLYLRILDRFYDINRFYHEYSADRGSSLNRDFTVLGTVL